MPKEGGREREGSQGHSLTGAWELGEQDWASGYHLLSPAKEPWTFTFTLEAPGNRKLSSPWGTPQRPIGGGDGLIL